MLQQSRLDIAGDPDVELAILGLAREGECARTWNINKPEQVRAPRRASMKRRGEWIAES
jgi:hypothetical protein